jgi:hypothetical protein
MPNPVASRNIADIVDNAPAAMLILRMLCAGVADIRRSPSGFCELAFHGLRHPITGTYTQLVNAIGWHRCVEALGEKA